ncbi:MAG: cytidylate kinase [Sphingomonas bacterium]|nr:(d)CMP kinase [Sphingomonas bacterium]MDB5689156.1 cytidylate kinase [Sphingomonas bacterium]
MIIAVDGPAASGKGTIARALARHFGIPHLDTGLLYRATGIGVLRSGGDPADPQAALAAAGFDDALLDDPALKSDLAGGAASIVSAHAGVRAQLLDRQRRFARRAGGAVLDGRDIGTVIAPDADAKLFVTARAEIRAARRHAELERLGMTTPLETVLADIRDRDARDAGRAAAPLVQAADAAMLDTSDLDVAGAVAAAIGLVAARVGPSPA